MFISLVLLIDSSTHPGPQRLLDFSSENIALLFDLTIKKQDHYYQPVRNI